MSCYHPLLGFYTGEKTATGKDDLLIVASDYVNIDDPFYSVSMAEKRIGHKLAYDPDFMRLDKTDMVLYKSIQIPCGHCIGCKLDYSRNWAMRCVMESKLYPIDRIWFVTLTFNDDNLPADWQVSKKVLQDFNKKLRSVYGNGIRFFGCGENGEKSGRPHYHVIYFNLPLDDLKPFGKGPTGDQYYVSERLSKLWEKGFVMVGSMSYKSAAYVARYSMKSFKKDDFFKPFLLMSRRPGIGHDWIVNHLMDVYSTDLVYADFGFAKYSKACRYFDSMLEKDYPDLFNDWKEIRRIVSDRSTESAMNVVGVVKKQHLLDYNEDIKERQIKRLKRF